jgi:hypothetical protein
VERARATVATMSSTLSRPPAATSIETVTIPAHPSAEQDESEFGGFVHAIVLGVFIGVPAVGLFIAALVKMAAPDTSTAGVIGIAVWVAAWIGMFLGGTVTVGLWSKRQHDSP